MKRILSALIMTTMIAAPAFARSAIERQPAPASDWYASPNSVYSDGAYRGTDPDPHIRLELRRESPHGGD